MGRPRKYSPGIKFGHWTVVSYGDPVRRIGGGITEYRLNCRCSCGKIVGVLMRSLRSGRSTSCGCKKKGWHGGLSTRYATTHQCWWAMISRCTNKKDKDHPRYGGSGISVCKRWMIFSNFLSDMGPRPNTKMSIDRRDGSKGYFLLNCRWATAVEQGSNRKDNVLLQVGKKTMSISSWSRETGVPWSTIRRRMKQGVALSKIFFIGRIS